MPPHPPQSEAFNASDPEQVKKREAEIAIRDEGRRNVNMALLATKAGREWCWHFMQDCHVFHTRVVGESEHMNGFYEGQREVGLNLMRVLCRAAPENFAQMVKENDGG